MANGIFICIYCRFLWSFNYIIAVTFTQSLTPFEIALGRWLVASVVAYLAWNSAVAKIGSVQTGIVYYTLPLFSGIEAYFFCWRRGFVAAGLRRNIGGVGNRFGEF